MRYLILYIPYILSTFSSADLNVSYLFAWLGSFFILWISISGRLKQFPNDLPWYEQLLRPLFLPQIIFAGFTTITSIFYFISLHGYYYFDKIHDTEFGNEIMLSASTQRYYVLGHAALVHGILMISKVEKPKFRIVTNDESTILLLFALIIPLLNEALGYIPGLRQFQVKLIDLELTSIVLCLSISIVYNKPKIILISLALFALILYKAVLSGWKEQVLVPVIMLFSLLYPNYKVKVSLIGIPALSFIVFILPTFVEQIRTLSWYNGVKSEQAAGRAYESISTVDSKVLEKNYWIFLTTRASESQMFNKFQKNVPDLNPYYNIKIIEQSILLLIPRIFFPDKPDSEKLVMERAYECGVIEYSSSVSAKPQLIVDGYLSFGAVGVWIFCFIMGVGSAKSSILAEKLFGGYLWGTCLVYTGVFQVFWRGNCLEFMLNSVFWSFVLMYILFFTGRSFGFIKRA